METIKRICRKCRPHARFAAIGFAALILANATRLILPLFSGWIVDDVIEGGLVEKLPGLCAGILGLTVLRAVCNYIRGVSFEKLSQNYVYDLRTSLYRHLSEMSYSFYDKNYIGEIMSRMTGDIEGIRNLLAGGVVQICENAIWFFGSLILLFFINWRLALVMVLIAPIVAVIALKFHSKIHVAFKDVREQNAVLSTKTQENISGVRVVKAFAQEEHEKQAFSVENRKQLRLLLRTTFIWSDYVPLLDFLGVSDCKMQEGSIRADVNVSVRPVGSEALGVRTEMKNLNSIKAVARAVRAEAERQIELLREGRAVRQETRRWDDNKGASFAMRSKENAQDYRYFPEPDLPPVVLDEAFLSQVRRSMPELPEQKRARYLAEYGLTERDAAILLRSARLCRLLEGLIGRGIPAREAANWTLGEVLRLLGEDGLEPADLEIDEEKLARALRLLAAGRIGRPAARRAVEAVYREGADPELFCREHGLFLEKVGEGDLAAAVAKVLAENADAVEKYRAGSDKVFGFLVGRCMAALRGKADPASVNRALREALKR